MSFQSYLGYLSAFVFVLVLIGLFSLILRSTQKKGSLFGFLSEPAKRLEIVETTTLDGRRRLMLIRRDNVEHLLLIGGPGDLIIETGIIPLPSLDTGKEETE